MLGDIPASEPEPLAALAGVKFRDVAPYIAPGSGKDEIAVVDIGLDPSIYNSVAIDVQRADPKGWRDPVGHG